MRTVPPDLPFFNYLAYYLLLSVLQAMLLSLMLLAALSSRASADENYDEKEQWELVKNDLEQDIRVYYRTQASGNVEFKGVSTVRSSLNTITALFLDLQTMPQWLYRTEKVTLLERIGADTLYAHMEHSMPFPFRKRDSVNRIELSQAQENKTLTIQVENVPDYIEPREDFVRVQVALSQWRLTPVGDGQIQITFTGYGEPGGSISSQTYHTALFRWLVKQFLWQVPYETLIKMERFLDREQYQNHRFEFIDDPYRR